jgi:hypothetical protein
MADAKRVGIEVSVAEPGMPQPATPAAPNGPARSLWDHNGSVVYLTAEGANRRFYYDVPRAGLYDVGVKQGTLLFEGRKEGERYSGAAYIFSQTCGPQAYAVSGPVASDQSRITITMSGHGFSETQAWWAVATPHQTTSLGTQEVAAVLGLRWQWLPFGLGAADTCRARLCIMVP